MPYSDADRHQRQAEFNAALLAERRNRGSRINLKDTLLTTTFSTMLRFALLVSAFVATAVSGFTPTSIRPAARILHRPALSSLHSCSFTVAPSASLRVREVAVAVRKVRH